MTSEDNASAEDRLIARFFAPLATHPGAFGLFDDAAAITPPPGCDLVLTADGIVGGVHFFPDESAGLVARRALRVNLSDLAAKGATPLGYLLTLALPPEAGEAWLSGFAEGLREDAALYDCPLLGGDSVRTPGPVTVSIAMFGSVPAGTMVRRAGAQPGDSIFVTGTVGDAALGLALLKGAGWTLEEAERQHLVSRYRLPQPRGALARAVRTHASAALDLSDGLAGDLAKLCRVSRVGAAVEAARAPISRAARELCTPDPAALETALTGGDDYEILCTVPPDRGEDFRRAAQEAGVPVTEIGKIIAGEGARFIAADGEALVFQRPAYSHF